jgi:hypothetical protein
LREAAESLPEVTLHLEHKPGDPRPVGFLDCSAKVLRLCGNIDRPGVGITFNVGHLLFGGGWPAAEFARVLDAGIPCYVHHDDGTVKWDWDLMAGSQDFWKLVEFLFYAKQSGYDGWFTADVSHSPRRRRGLCCQYPNHRSHLELVRVRGLARRPRIHSWGRHRSTAEEITKWVCLTDDGQFQSRPQEPRPLVVDDAVPSPF